MWKPVRYRGGIYCDYAIDGLAQPVRGAAMGGDTLQALTLALRGIWLELAPLRDVVDWEGVQGWLGLPFTFDYPEDFAQQRRVEQLVTNEEMKYFDRVLRPMRQRETRLRRLYDPDDRQPDYAVCSRDVALEALRAAAASERRYRDEENDEGATFFYAKGLSIAGRLRARADLDDLLTEMLRDPSPRLRLLAAETLRSSAARAALAALRDGGVEPEASEARRALGMLDARDRTSARPKPWDDDISEKR